MILTHLHTYKNSLERDEALGAALRDSVSPALDRFSWAFLVWYLERSASSYLVRLQQYQLKT